MRYWKRLNQDGGVRTVESYSHRLDIPDAIEISEAEFNDLMAKLTVEPQPQLDWQSEWDKASDKEKVNILARMLGLKA